MSVLWSLLLRSTNTGSSCNETVQNGLARVCWYDVMCHGSHILFPFDFLIDEEVEKDVHKS